jgi:hypothetical protein
MTNTSCANRIRVKFLSKSQAPDRNYDLWLKRFPNHLPRWGACDFIFDQECRDYDWLMVYDDLPKSGNERFPSWAENLPCPVENTLLITAEPSAIKNYGRAFVNQFGWILSSQEAWAIKHPRVIQSQTGYIWFYGGSGERGSYDTLARQSPPVKSLPISTVCSNKQMRHTLHHARYQFTQQLKARLPALDIFGQGVRPIDDKADALDPYRLHLAIENHICPHHWTEKLSDPFLGFCLPVYHGCPNTRDYFPEESYIPVNIHNPDEAFERISRALRDHEYEKRLPAIIEARRLILNDYALFPLVARLIEERHQFRGRTPAAPHVIYSRRALRKKRPFAAVFDAMDKTALTLRNQFAKRSHHI